MLIDISKTWVNLDEVAGLVDNTKYIIQLREGCTAFFEVSATTPDPNDGFVWNNIKPIEYTPVSGKSLYVRAANDDRLLVKEK